MDLCATHFAAPRATNLVAVTERLTQAQDAAAVSLIRGLALDAPLYAKSGHQGTAMALAPLGHVLFSRILNHDPANPRWRNRDRFILSNGHASILQYALLFLNGYGLELEDIKAFRQWDSQTPGHPEVGHTAGVEVTTGPLGQGFANAVGMAIAERNLRARFGSLRTDHHTFVIAGDGCLMEGVSHEAASLAGHLGLDRLICIFDDNGITIDGSTALSCSDDVAMRFTSYGWNVVQLGEIGNDLDALETNLNLAKQNTGKPTLLMLKTRIGFPSPDLTDSHEAHGNPFTAELASRTKAVMGIPDEPFWAPASTVNELRQHAKARGALLFSSSAECGRKAQAIDAKSETEYEAAWNPPRSSEFASSLPMFDANSNLATRQSIQKVLEAATGFLPSLITGSADLTGNTGVKVSAHMPHGSATPAGRQIFFGIREHAMGSAMVGMALHGGVLPVGGTFFVFADYMRPALRLAALSKAKVIFVFSHDSVGVGEDGPTHQPVEQLASLRAIPGLRVIRPADSNETKAAWCSAVDFDGPTALILSRQNLPLITDGTAVITGAAIVREVENSRATLVGTGSELALCMQAAEALGSSGVNVRVVSMPSWDVFDSQPRAFRDSVLSPNEPAISVEAGTTFGWAKYVDASVGIDRFGASAPGAVALDRLGINITNVVATVRDAIDAFR